MMYFVTGLTCAGAGGSIPLDWRGVLEVKACAKRKRNCSQLLRPLTSHNKIRPKSYRIVCSNVQPEEPGNKDYDDHDADDVKNVHCTLRLRHARLQYESTMLQ